MRFNKERSLFFLFCLMVFSPVFINLDLTQGVRFDADPFNHLGVPSIPFSLLFLAPMILFGFVRLTMPKSIFILSILLLFFSLLSYFSIGSFRAFILMVLILFPLYCYFLFRRAITGFICFRTLSRYFLNFLLFFVLTKISSDFVFFGSFLSNYFVFESLRIYNFYDYYPFVYLVCLVVSIYCISIRVATVRSFLLIFLSAISIFHSESRLFTVAFFIFPFIFYFLKKVNLRFYPFSFITALMVIFITLIVANTEGLGVDNSLEIRFSHWQHFIGSIDLISLFFPFLNQYRVELGSGTLHNEFLEIYSYFGFCFFVYYFFWVYLFNSVDKSFLVLSKSLFFVLSLGMLVQLNMTNLYLSIVLSFLLAVYSKREGC